MARSPAASEFEPRVFFVIGLKFGISLLMTFYGESQAHFGHASTVSNVLLELPLYLIVLYSSTRESWPTPSMRITRIALLGTRTSIIILVE